MDRFIGSGQQTRHIDTGRELPTIPSSEHYYRPFHIQSLFKYARFLKYFCLKSIRWLLKIHYLDLNIITHSKIFES